MKRLVVGSVILLMGTAQATPELSKMQAKLAVDGQYFVPNQVMVDGTEAGNKNKYTELKGAALKLSLHRNGRAHLSSAELAEALLLTRTDNN